MQKDNRRLTVFAVLALIGLALSISLTLHYYDLRSGTAEFKSFCNMNETMNCDAVGASRFAEILPGFPLSSFSGGWYLGMFFLALLAMAANWRRTVSRVLLAMSGIALAFSLIYLVIMATVLKVYCLQCLGIDVVNAALFVTAFSMRGTSGAKSESGQMVRALGTAAACLTVSVLFMKSYDRSQIEGVTHDEMAESVLSAQPVALPAAPDAPFFGAANAPITIVEFSDFQCPHCKVGAKLMHTLLERFPGQLKVVFRGYPLDPSCNRFMQSAGHPIACEAAKVAVCSNQQGKFGAVYEAIFDHQADLRPGMAAELATGLGVDAAKLKACMDAPEVGQFLAKSVEEGNANGVKSTPTFFINGRKVEGAYPVPVWVKVIDQLLAAGASK